MKSDEPPVEVSVHKLDGDVVPSREQACDPAGSATLRPRPGRTLPHDLRPRNVGRLAQRLTEGVRDPEFKLLVHRIDTGPIHAGNKVEVFFDGQQAFAAVADAMDKAANEILLETYILKDDAAGQDLAARLGRAAARGVKVRVLADAFGSWTTSRRFWRQLQQRGIEARLFHPFKVHLWRHFIRDHRKIIVIDRRVSFTGGMNVGNEYGSSRQAREGLWRDTHARIAGPTAWEMALVFQEGWTHAGGEPFPIAQSQPTGNEGADILVLDSRPGRGYAETSAVLAAIVGASRKRLWITNSYFAPRPVGIHVLGQAARRGVDVRLLLPGISDVPIVRHAGHGFFAGLLNCGVRIFEYQPAILHAKTLVADDFATVLGSSNLDFRSFHFNAECNLLILNDEIGQIMSRAFETDLEQSVEVQNEQWRQRAVAHRIGDALARRLSPLL